MKKFSKLVSCALALTMVFSLAACSGNTDKAGTTAAPAETEAPDGTTAAGGEESQAPEGTTAAAEGTKAAADTNGKTFKIGINEMAHCDPMAEKLVNDGCDLILAIATPAGQAVAGKTTEIPILVTAVTDPADAGLVDSNEVPGGNVSGTSDLTPVKEQFQLLQQILPDAKKVAILYCSSEDNSIFQANLAKAECEALKLEYEEVTVSESNQIQQVAESLIGKYDVVYIPTDNLLAEGMATVTQVTNANDLPTIVGEKGMVENGGLATYGIDYYNLGVMTGEQAADILLNGADISQMPIGYQSAEDCELTVNTTAAKDLGIEIPEEILKDAAVIE